MIRYLIALACCLLVTPAFSYDEEAKEEFFPSTPEQIASLSSEPSYLIGGVISSLSGQPVLRETDLVAKGAQNIVLSRTYTPPSMPCSFGKFKHNQGEYDKYHLYHHLSRHYKGWQFYPHLKLKFTPHTMGVLLTDTSGTSLDFRLSGPNYSVATIFSSDGLSNAAGDSASGKYDPRNTRISYEENGNRITVYSTDGATRFYLRNGWLTQTERLYLLEKEILPNGKVLKYRYSDTGQPNYIESLDPKERFVYASIRIQGSPWEGSCHFTSSSGLTADYSYQRKPLHIKIKEKGKHWYGNDEHNATYHYLCPPILTSISSPSYRQETLSYCDKFLLNSCSGKDDIFNAHHEGFGTDTQHFRVDKLFLPVGKNDAFVPVYELSYQPAVPGQREGTTTLKNSDGTSTVYHFSKKLLVTSIQYFGQDREFKKEKFYSWDDKQWLKSIEMRDGQKNILYRKSFEYDRFGNPILEMFTGNLTGEGNQETFTIKRAFSEDGRNLLLREESEDGKVICFSYLPNTNLVTCKLTKDVAKIVLREFSVYDDCNNLIQTISDDGASVDKDDLSCVTQRRLTTYTPRQAAPFLHMPEWIEETYWESGAEKLLKKSQLIYDQHGNIAQEEVYDAEGKHAYTICKTYNERGDVLTETNRLGQQAVYTYDARGRSETATNFSHRLHTTLRHDTKGRLQEQIEKGDNGIIHVASSEYDFHDRKVQKSDLFQNVTRYTYDPLVNQVAKTEFPSIPSIDGRATSVSTLSTYDPFGRQLTKTDANGSTATYSYNAYGSPAVILHPHGGREIFRYEKNGQLNCHTDLDGLATYYKRDSLGRVLIKTYVSADSKTIAQETFTYNGFNLLTETNKEGNTKKFSYDGAGRKIQEEFCGQVTDFGYDALGWLATTCRYNGDHTLFIRYKRDLEGRILEELKTDAAGNSLYKTNYSYDGDGNRETITRYIHGKEAIATFVYDSFQRLVEKRDAEGYVTKTVYDENHTDALGQKVLQIVTTDPRHTATLETKDVLSRTTKKETLDSQKTTIACQEITYDPHGNLLYRRDHVYENGHFQNTQTIKYSYTPDHQIASFIRACGTQDARTTTFTYLPSGKIATKTLPDGVTLTYSYHPLGFLSRLDSSDGKISHAFDYDRLGYLRYAVDEKQDIAISREVDPFGNVRREVFPHHLEVKKDYDDLNRLISLKMGSQGEVLYVYDPLFLRSVIRTSSRGETLYAHTYENYDEDGDLITENLIGNLGCVNHAFDPRGHKAFISSPYFSQQCEYDAVGNLASNITDRTETQYTYDGLSQLSSENSATQSLTYAYDSVYNRTQKNGEMHEVNNLNELISIENSSYDLNGNQTLLATSSETFRLAYDPLNRLIEASSEKQKVNFTYDPLGRRFSKTVFAKETNGWKETHREHYLYHGQNEIGAFDLHNEPKNLRVLGIARHKDNPATIGVELEGQIFAPILDVQGNIRRLVDLKTSAITNRVDFTAFGEQIQTSSQPSLFNPWHFASKRFDAELGLVYFGKRYYDPLFGRWLSVDPAGFVDSANLYQYLLNNPFYYFDPDGQEAITISLTLWGTSQAGGLSLAALTGPVGWAIGGAAILTTVIVWKGPEISQKVNQWMNHKAESQPTGNEISWKNTSVYTPDRPLPRDPRTKEPVPEVEAPHTELGIKKGTKGKYPQAREFDAQGRPVKDIDFTDHGRPQNHPNPHEHTWKPNPTGGTPQRSPEAELLTK